MINKSDGDLIPAANRTKAEYTSALKFMQPKSPFWNTAVMKISSKKNQGVDEVWEKLVEFKNLMFDNGEFLDRRKKQQSAWMWHYIRHKLIETFQSDPELRRKQLNFEEKVYQGDLNPGIAADLLLAEFFKKSSK